MAITPKNWKEFQHYKDRSPPWIKLHRGLLDNYEFHCLPDASKALAPLLWLLASEYADGKITLSLSALAFRFRTTEEKINEALKPLIEADFFTSDSALLAPCKRSAIPEGEGETQEQTETEVTDRASRENYEFRGTVIRLKSRDFIRWRDAYSFLNLLAELLARDAWLASDAATDRDRKNWFVSTSKYLANRDAEARARGIKRDDVHPDEIYAGLQ